MAEIELMGMPVWVYAKNIDDQKPVAPNQLMTGHVGEPYQVEPAEIDGYTFVKAKGETNGVLNDEMHTVTLYYRPAHYLEAQKLTNKYLHIKQPVATYLEMNGEQDGSNLWPDTVVPVSSRVATQDGTFWYELADSRWVPFSMQNMQLSSERGDRSDEQPSWLKNKVWDTKKISVMGVIDFIPNQTLNVYDQPYGQVIGQLADGTPVNLIEEVTDGAGNLWYHLDQYGWVSSLYVKIK